MLAGDDRHQGFQVHLGPIRAGERCGEAQVGFPGKRAFLQLPAALQVLFAEQQADVLADQLLGAIADHLAEGCVDHQEVAGGVHLDITVADCVEDGLVAGLALLQAFDHVVEFAAELAQFARASFAQALQVRVMADGAGFPVQALQRADDPEFEDEITHRQRRQDHRQRFAEEQPDGLLALLVDLAGQGDLEAELRFAQGVEEHHVDLPPGVVEHLAFVEHHPAVQSRNGKRAPGAVQLGGREHAHVRPDLQLIGLQALVVEQHASDQGAVRIELAAVVADRVAEQHDWRATDHQQLGESRGALLEIQRADPFGALHDGLFQTAVILRPWPHGNPLLRVGQIPFLGDHLAIGIEVEDEVETEMLEHVDLEVFVDVILGRVVDELVAFVPPGIDADEVQVAFALVDQAVVEDAHLVIEALAVHAVVAAEEYPVGQQPHACKGDGQQWQEQPEQALAKSHVPSCPLAEQLAQGLVSERIAGLYRVN
ncbi:hypothetical protein D3C78_790600 [compost metagenome]